MSEPLISVIVPVYKVEEYIHQCVDSIVGQTYRNLEIILVDDGSPDSCPMICDEYAKKDSRIKVIHKENGGLSDARNAGMSICTGDYIAFVDSDDWIEPEMYFSMIAMMQEKNLDIVFCTVREIINGEKAGIRYEYYPDGTIIDAKEIQKLVLKDEIAAAVWFRLCKRECLKHVQFPVGRTYEDIAVVFWPFEDAKKPVGFINQPFYNYRINESGIAHQRKPLTRYHMFLSYRDCYDFAKSNVTESEEGARILAARFAMGTYLDYHCYGWVELVKFLPDVESFLQENKGELLKSKSMPRSQKYSTMLYYASKPLFKRFYQVFIKLRDKT